MTEKKRAQQEEPRRVDTGGGAYVGGDVHAGRDFVGRDQIHVTSGVTVDQFRELLAQIRQEVNAAGLEPDVTEVIDADVRVIEDQTNKKEPNKAIVVSKLGSISEVLKSTAAIATASATLVPLVQKAIQWAGQLF
jgi:hypothetical protein